MKDTSPPARASGRWLVALVALAFVAGLTLMSVAARRWHWFGPAPQAAATPQTVIPAGAAAAVAPQPTPAPLVAPAASLDAAALASREATLAGQIAALEARIATIGSDAAAAGSQAERAEALLIAVAARRQIDAGRPLGYLEEQLRQRFGARQPRAVARVIGLGSQPVTLMELSAGLERQIPTLLKEPEDDLLDTLRRELATLVVLRRNGTPSPLPADRLDRARDLLSAGRVGAARDEVAALPGAPAAAAWLAAARRWVLIHEALDLIETAALTVPPAAPAQPAVPVTTTVLP